MHLMQTEVITIHFLRKRIQRSNTSYNKRCDMLYTVQVSI